MISLRRGDGIRWPRFLRGERPDGSRLWHPVTSEAHLRTVVERLAPAMPADTTWSVTANDRE